MVDVQLPRKWADEIVTLADSYPTLEALRADLAQAEQDTCCKGDCFICVLATRAMLQHALRYKEATVSDAK